MIRLSLTNIELSRRDLIDYDRRKNKSKANERVDLPSLELLRIKSKSDRPDIVEKEYAGFRSPARNHERSIPTVKPTHQDDTVNQDEQYASSENLSPGQGSPASEESEEQDHIQISQYSLPEYGSPDPQQEQQQQQQQRTVSQPTKDDFHYGGFVETPRTTADNTRHSSPFLPDDISTPPQLQLPPQRLGSRNLPRSPLFISQNASTSPEQRHGFSLTPRVAARIANHNNPGVLFAQPARRPPRQHRHQTNSFSFDSTERSSAAYEQDRVASDSTNISRAVTDEISLHDDLRGSSLQSSRVVSAVSEIDAAAYNGDESSIGDGISRLVERVERSREFIFSPPQLPLPHPFSSVARSSSPESPQSQHSQPASPLRGNSSQLTQGTQEERQSPTPSPTYRRKNAISGESGVSFNGESGISSSPPVRPGFSPRSLLRQAQRVISSQRVRSPHRNVPSPERYAVPNSPTSTAATATPRQSNRLQRRPTVPQTPSQPHSVYLDNGSPTQPQTPANLPESRHRSTYHPSYTAPVTRTGTRDLEATRTPVPPSAQRSTVRSVWRSFRTHRAASPTGMQQEGFRGLYGGRENGDEEQSWVEGVRFNNAESSLWGQRDARNDGRNLRETPEPDDWRVGDRI